MIIVYRNGTSKIRFKIIFFCCVVDLFVLSLLSDKKDMTDQQLLQLVREGKDQKVLVKLYRYQSRVVTLIKSRGGSKEDGEDVFQDALIVFCKKAKDEAFELTSKIDTYLYSVAYYIWKNRAEKENRWVSVSSTPDVPEDSELEAIAEKESQIKKIEQTLQKVGQPCLRLLQLFYYEGLSFKEIMSKMKYKTVNVAKTQKYKCIEKIRKTI